jgi:hypothetical protein
MTATSVAKKAIGAFNLEADSIDQATDELIARLIMQYRLIQPWKSGDDFLEEIFEPLFASTLEDPIHLNVSGKTMYSAQANRGFMILLVTSCAHCVEALKADEGGNQMRAWNQIASATYYLGKLEGLSKVEPAIDHIIASRSAKGASKRSEKFAPIREFARELASHQTHETKRKAALLIKKAVLAFADKSEVEMSEYEAERTIIKWLDGMTFATK